MEQKTHRSHVLRRLRRIRYFERYSQAVSRRFVHCVRCTVPIRNHVICYSTLTVSHKPQCARTDILLHSRAVAPASWLQTCPGRPRNQPRAARKLSRSVLLPNVRRRQFHDLQPRDVDNPLYFSCTILFAVVGLNTIRQQPQKGFHMHVIQRVLLNKRQQYDYCR